MRGARGDPRPYRDWLDLHTAGRLAFFGDQTGLREQRAFTHLIARLRKKNWMVYAKPRFGGPEAVLAYLSRYTHRVAISNRRLISLDEKGVTFRYKGYRRDGAGRYPPICGGYRYAVGQSKHRTSLQWGYR